MRYVLAFAAALAGAALLTPLVRWCAFRIGAVVAPRADRWHARPTPVLGGIAMYLAFAGACIGFAGLGPDTVPLLVCATLIFALGLVDDLKGLTPQVKFTGQIVVAALLIGMGTVLEILPWPVISYPLTFFWVVGLTNAFNLTDNMDGLSAGIGAISSTALFLFSLPYGNEVVALLSAALAGACIGFLFYNFNPARIFMGDCGSMFLGFTLAALSITGTWKHASSLVVTLLLPVMVLGIPIFDTAFVTLTRRLRGQPISQGGRDHVSHRLVAMGFSERRAVLILYGISAMIALATLFFSGINPLAFAGLVAVLGIGLFYFAVYLRYAEGRNGNSSPNAAEAARWKANALLVNLQRLVQMCIDLVLVVLAYFSAYLIRFESGLPDLQVQYFINTLPVVIGVKIAAFYYFGLYQTMWRHVGVRDFIAILKAVVVSALVIVTLILMYARFEYFSRTVFVIDGMLCLLLVSGAHFFMRILREYLESQPTGGRTVIIVGAGDAGEMTLREIRNNPELKYHVAGFVDDDPFKQRRKIHDVKVLGTIDALGALARRSGAREAIIAIASLSPQRLQEIEALCRRHGVACRRLGDVTHKPAAGS
jgi:UDP-GlcNAc:undecaprenyl-phosphate GlcNAc-1-phosphate transferase